MSEGVCSKENRILLTMAYVLVVARPLLMTHAGLQSSYSGFESQICPKLCPRFPQSDPRTCVTGETSANVNANHDLMLSDGVNDNMIMMLKMMMIIKMKITTIMLEVITMMMIVSTKARCRSHIME